MNFIDYTSKFAGIFSKDENGDYIISDIALIDYDTKTNEFEVESGIYSGLTYEDFGIITTDPDDLLEVPTVVDVDSNDEENDLIIIFDNDYVDEIKNSALLDSELEAITYLACELGKLKIHANLDGSLYTMNRKDKRLFSVEEIEDNLYNNKNNNTTIKPFDDIPNHIDSNNILNPIDLLVGSLFGMNSKDIKVVPINIRKPQVHNDQSYDEMISDLEDRIEFIKKQREEKKAREKNIDTRKVISETASKIVGQEYAIKTLVNQIYNNQKIIDDITKEDNFDVTELDARKTSILLDGETGTGKTAILKDIAKQLHLPIVIASATSFSETGYVGASITDLLRDLLDQADDDLEKAQRGIIVFDEVDKLAFSKNSVYGVDMREGVQHELLSFIGGGEYDISMGGYFGQKIKFNTSKNTFILSGAFTDLREEKIKEVDKSHQAMGFSTNNNDDYEKEYVVTPDDYIKYGLMREFFGRIKVLASTKSYTLDDCKEILTKSVISPLLNFEKTVKMYGYPGIKYNEEFLNRVAEEGMKMKTGARGLQTVMSGIQNNLLDGLINGEFDKTKPIELTISMIDEYKKSFVRKY